MFNNAILLSLLTLATAAPTALPSNLDQRANTCSGPGAFYLCANNGFRGSCTSDPCALPWCPDFAPGTCSPAGSTAPPTTPPPVTTNPNPNPVPKPAPTQCGSGSGAFYVCASNGFRGSCSSDPCDKVWCPDFEPGTCTKAAPATTVPSTPVVQPPVRLPSAINCPGSGGAFYICANNGFRGYCSADPCDKAWCVDFVPGTCDKQSTVPPVVQPPVTQPPVTTPPTAGQCQGKGAYYVCANNGFRGACSSDPCALPWCPDYNAGTCTPKKM